MAKQRPCRPAGTLACQRELLDAAMTGKVRNRMKPATTTSVNDGLKPCAARHTPASAEEINTPFARFRGPPHTVIATPPSNKPLPLMAYCMPTPAGVENDNSSGVIPTRAIENRKLLEP